MHVNKIFGLCMWIHKSNIYPSYSCSLKCIYRLYQIVEDEVVAMNNGVDSFIADFAVGAAFCSLLLTAEEDAVKISVSRPF